MPRTQSEKQKKHAQYMREYIRRRKKEDPLFHEKEKKRSKDFYNKSIKKIKSNPEEYIKYKKQNAEKAKIKRKKLKENPEKYKEFLIKDRAQQKKRLKKMSSEEKYEMWKRARVKYRSTEKGMIARKRWKQSDKSKQYDQEYSKKYRAIPENRERLAKLSVAATKKRYHNDIEFRLRHRLSNIMRRAVRAQRTGKSKKTAEIVGCDFQYLIKYLESKFKNGMSWNNMGEWHIDHIKPCKSFDLTKKEEQEKCFHYTNLQPLWALENIKKSAKISKEYNND